uniref:TGS domain-containing protein n=1 Tax=Macrostomum lignano TaxID=282301 RepID=A0A1I8FD74_9PLAT
MSLATLRRSLPLCRLALYQQRSHMSADHHASSSMQAPSTALSSTDSSAAAVSGDAQQAHRLAIFNEEFERQLKRSKRSIDKIEVVYTGPDGQSHSLFLNKGVSTPLDAAKHLSEELSSESVLAIVNGSTAWDMHRPLNTSCSLAFLNFKTPGSKEEADVEASSTTVSVAAGSGEPLTWSPSRSELRGLSLAAERLMAADHAFQPMDAPGPVVMEMFKHNEAKQQIQASNSQHNCSRKPDQILTVCIAWQFCRFELRPMISRTGLIGRFAFAAVHQIDAPDFGQLMRVQGFAVPRAFLTHFSSVELLEQRAAVLNRAFLPTKPGTPRRPQQQQKQDRAAQHAEV